MEKKAIKGTLFLSAYNIDRTKFLKSGEKIESYYQEGFSTCDEKDTPLDSCAVYVLSLIHIWRILHGSLKVLPDQTLWTRYEERHQQFNRKRG